MSIGKKSCQSLMTWPNCFVIACKSATQLIFVILRAFYQCILLTLLSEMSFCFNLGYYQRRFIEQALAPNCLIAFA